MVCQFHRAAPCCLRTSLLSAGPRVPIAWPPSVPLRKQVGRYGNGVFDFSAERVTASVRESLARLQLSYVDLIQTHDIEFGSLDQVRACMFACFPFSGVLLVL